MNARRWIIRKGSWAVCLSALLGADNLQRPVAPPVAVPYAAERKLSATDFVRFDWNDSARNRAVPVKIYFPTDGSGPFPVIIFSHGLGGTRETYEYLGRQWAANGYVSVHLQHIGTDDSAWRGQDKPMESMKRAINLQQAIERAKDVHFAIDQLELINQNDPTLKGKLDLKNIGVAGHSYGSNTALLIAGQKMGGKILAGRIGDLTDSRVKAVIPMSASTPLNRAALDEIFGDIHVPIFYMTGTQDDSPFGDTKAADRRLPYDHTKAIATYLLIINGGDHMTFSGHIRREAGEKDDELQKWIRLSSTAFWDVYLKNDDAAKKWLINGGLKQALADEGTFEQK